MGERRKTPQEKKRLSLERDHPLLAEYPKAFRKKYPRKRRKAQKGLRTKVSQELHRASGPHDEALADRVVPERFRRKEVRKWGAAQLGEVIKSKQERRVQSYRRKKDAQAARRGGMEPRAE